MKKLKIYLETTVFNFKFADDSPDKRQDAIKLFDEINQGKYIPYTSNYVLQELLRAEEPKRTEMVNLIEQYNVHVLPADENAERLADKYVSENIIPQKYKTDGIHIAMATINDMDIIVSYNFHHIVKLKTIIGTESINIREGYKKIGIYSSTEVIEMMNEPKALKEIHDIREKIYEETKDMTPLERVKYADNDAQKLIQKYNLKVKCEKALS